ncbi:hypothetical protein P7K49_030251, partial [Saguinus oedipus]
MEKETPDTDTAAPQTPPTEHFCPLLTSQEDDIHLDEVVHVLESRPQPLRRALVVTAVLCTIS